MVYFLSSRETTSDAVDHYCNEIGCRVGQFSDAKQAWLSEVIVEQAAWSVGQAKAKWMVRGVWSDVGPSMPETQTYVVTTQQVANGRQTADGGQC